MGVNCRIYLPANARATDIAKVLAALDGCLTTWHQHSTTTRWAENEVTVTASIPCFAKIEWKDRSWFLHFEPDHMPGYKLLMPSSTPRHIALGKGLVDFFGGFLDEDDCDGQGCDYAQIPKSNEENGPTGGAAWDALQARIMAVTPITLSPDRKGKP
jgi:hypothetical protein